MKKVINFILKISISVALLIFLFTKINLRSTFLYIRAVELKYLICGFVLFLFVIFLCLLRWIILLNALKKNISVSRIFTSFSGGLFFNLFLPSAIGGDVARVVDLSIHTKDASNIFATVFLDRFLGAMGLALVSFLSFLFGYIFSLTCDLRLFTFIILLVIATFFTLFMLFTKSTFNFIIKFLFPKSFKNLVVKLHTACYGFRLQKKATIYSIILSVILQAIYSISFYFIGRSLGINLSIVYYFILVPIIGVITMLPISIGGLGLRDNVAVVLFSAFGIVADKIVAMTLLNFVFLFIIGITGGIVYGTALYSRRL